MPHQTACYASGVPFVLFSPVCLDSSCSRELLAVIEAGCLFPGVAMSLSPSINYVIESQVPSPQ